jgi:PPE-repeat protein
MDFGALPPEINSARMYVGPGSAPMLAAAAAWGGLAAELTTTASGYQSVVSQLTGDGWLGPASAAMAASAEPYVTWLLATATRAEQAAANASAAAGAYDSAFAMTVPPAEVAANRALLAALVATNFLGLNTPAIAATEAQYGEMWAQDAAAMYGYAAGSASASELMPFAQPAQTTNPAGQGEQATAVAHAVGTAGTQDSLSQVISTLPGALHSLASPVSSSGLGQLLGVGGPTSAAGANPVAAGGLWDFLNTNFVNGIVSGGYINPAIITPAVLSGMSDVNSLLTPGLAAPVMPPGGGFDIPAFAGYTAGHGPSPALGGMSAIPARSALVGRLSVPQGWIAATQVANHAGTALPGAGWTSTPTAESVSAGTPGLPGMPFASGGGHGFGNGPRYGFRPTIMSRPPAAG